MLYIDLHNHLNLLSNPINFYNRAIAKQENYPNEILDKLTQNNEKAIIGVALYNFPILNFGIKTVAAQIERTLKQFGPGVQVIKEKSDLQKDFHLGLVFQVESLRWFNYKQTDLEHMAELGVRGFIPVHFLNNRYGASGEDPRNLIFQKSGLTDEGKELLQGMGELPFWIDVSHMEDQTCLDSLELSRNPIVATHIGARSLVPRKRNISDELTKKVFSKNGYIGLISWRALIGKEEEDFSNHVNKFCELGGEDNLFLGTDLGAPIKTIHGVNSCFSLAQEINKKNLSESVIEKIRWKNAYNFLELVLP